MSTETVTEYRDRLARRASMSADETASRLVRAAAEYQRRQSSPLNVSPPDYCTLCQSYQGVWKWTPEMHQHLKSPEHVADIFDVDEDPMQIISSLLGRPDAAEVAGKALGAYWKAQSHRSALPSLMGWWGTCDPDGERRLLDEVKALIHKEDDLNPTSYDY